MTEKLLTVRNVTRQFGGLTAVNDVSMTIYDNELVALIGPNGAGKTTLFNMLSGLLPATSGTIAIRHDGRFYKVSGKGATSVAQHGISRTFQNIRLFGDMTVRENIMAALNNQFKENFWSTIFHTPGYYRTEREMNDEAQKLIDRYHLTAVADSPANKLPYGMQRRVEIVRALATNPKIIFLDEPAAGMNPEETAELTKMIRQLRDENNLAVLLIEHDMSLVMSLAERIYVLDQGEVLASGTPKEVSQNPAVVKAYLGGDINAAG